MTSLEVVGGIASIVALIETGASVAESFRKLVLSWRDAPKEVRSLTTQLLLLAAQLQNLQRITGGSHPDVTDIVIRQSVSGLLNEARNHLGELTRLHIELQTLSRARQRLGWVLREKDVRNLLSKTQEIEQRLANVVALMVL